MRVVLLALLSLWLISRLNLLQVHGRRRVREQQESGARTGDWPRQPQLQVVYALTGERCFACLALTKFVCCAMNSIRMDKFERTVSV